MEIHNAPEAGVDQPVESQPVRPAGELDLSYGRYLEEVETDRYLGVTPEDDFHAWQERRRRQLGSGAGSD